MNQTQAVIVLVHGDELKKNCYRFSTWWSIKYSTWWSIKYSLSLIQYIVTNQIRWSLI